MRTTIDALLRLCAFDATTIWTRTRRDPDRRGSGILEVLLHLEAFRYRHLAEDGQCAHPISVRFDWVLGFDLVRNPSQGPPLFVWMTDPACQGEGVLVGFHGCGSTSLGGMLRESAILNEPFSS
ncbi:hypothetical protein AB0B68_17650 [Micromonospora sp. NPDC049049]|uniref:hypothetical protein n=1 Tax=Micromonospora sp. NPDC049049 TaxID=3155495 RepID=UPI0033F992C0